LKYVPFYIYLTVKVRKSLEAINRKTLHGRMVQVFVRERKERQKFFLTILPIHP
jgi:hypothetical protein